MSTITLMEMFTIIISLSAVVGAIAVLTKPFRKLIKDVDSLNLAVFGKDGKELNLATKADITGVGAAIKELAEATNLMYNALIVIIESQPGNEELNKVKKQLNGHKTIV